MTKKMILVGFVVAIMVAASGCAEIDVQPKDTDTGSVSSSFSESKEIAETVPSAEVVAESVQSEAMAEEKVESEVVSQKKITTSNEPKDTEVEEEHLVSTTKQEAPKSKEEYAKEPTLEETQPPKNDEPTETPKEEVVEEVKVDIYYWISYAKNYATGIGLELDSTAVECWDNPIAVNPKCTTTEESIISRLNRYKDVEEFTAIWVWVEKVSENGYELYIGYA